MIGLPAFGDGSPVHEVKRDARRGLDFLMEPINSNVTLWNYVVSLGWCDIVPCSATVVRRPDSGVLSRGPTSYWHFFNVEKVDIDEAEWQDSG